MRERLRNTRQQGRSVQTYVYELENLFLVLGMDRNEERVDAFWFGLDKYIQSELWKQMMNLKSPYEDVKARAQVIELALTVEAVSVKDKTLLQGPAKAPEVPLDVENSVAIGGLEGGRRGSSPSAATLAERMTDLRGTVKDVSLITAATTGGALSVISLRAGLSSRSASEKS
ncbi:hypothetical protein L226DRAFT_565231 [Lentinus tigrinus ALCF2SS1-7]|uniref:uncharacterized protein n=1 Tax=Lentinus tigrinus ALCF2SS1-7 TaxID=1328758 RepID=UPI001165EFC2|nr:hypothetical protein L226DRAFT_565231 [Lentinus tigrinus ALCF2SS1-7]